MTPLMFVAAALAVMKLLDWLDSLVPESWARVFTPWFKHTMALVASGLFTRFALKLDYHSWDLTMVGLGVAGLASIFHQAHRVLSARADDCQQQVVLRHRQVTNRR